MLQKNNKTKWLLLQDVFNLGRSGEIITCKPGYARNFLEPQGKVIRADKNTLRLQEKLQQERVLRSHADKKEAEELAALLKGVVLETTVKSDKGGHLYGSVASQDVAHLLEALKGVKLNKKAFLIRKPIKQVGTYTIDIALNEGVSVKVQLKVLSTTPIEIFQEVVEKVTEPVVEVTTK
jgi:large subunit ribosomal protein L9